MKNIQKIKIVHQSSIKLKYLLILHFINFHSSCVYDSFFYFFIMLLIGSCMSTLSWICFYFDKRSEVLNKLLWKHNIMHMSSRDPSLCLSCLICKLAAKTKKLKISCFIHLTYCLSFNNKTFMDIIVTELITHAGKMPVWILCFFRNRVTGSVQLNFSMIWDFFAVHL